ncbi:sigma-70 family RNA polymerase sigma factor [Bacillus salipaludis]|uniref:Sigma-70 family RNA polymerase sigma factor n=1 Tax=Bacillus salipaludis TaxID=2547811 RepID=A0ABW8RHZ8_9BACI
MESFEQLATQYTPMIHKIIHSLNIYQQKEEFFQEGLIALWQASSRFNSQKGNFTNYAYTYIKGYLLMKLKNIYKDKQRSVHPDEAFWETIVDHQSASPLEEEIILSNCTTLTEKQKKWLCYTVLDGLSVKEVAEKEKVSISAVKNWRKEAREKLRDQR